MGQREIKPPEREESEGFMQALRDLARRFERIRLSPEQRDEVRSYVERMHEALQRTGMRGQAVTQAPPSRTQAPAPVQAPPASASVPRQVVAPARRYVYDVVLEGTRYVVELERRLTPGREGAELLRMARNGEFFESLPRRPGESQDDYHARQVQARGWPRPCVSVRRVAEPSEPRQSRAAADAFNRQAESARADDFQVALGRAEERAIPERTGESREALARRRDANSSAVPLSVNFREERPSGRGG